MHFKTGEDKSDIKALKLRVASLDDSHSQILVCFTPNSLKGGITFIIE